MTVASNRRRLVEINSALRHDDEWSSTRTALANVGIDILRDVCCFADKNGRKFVFVFVLQDGRVAEIDVSAPIVGALKIQQSNIKYIQDETEDIYGRSWQLVSEINMARQLATCDPQHSFRTSFDDDCNSESPDD